MQLFSDSIGEFGLNVGFASLWAGRSKHPTSIHIACLKLFNSGVPKKLAE